MILVSALLASVSATAGDESQEQKAPNSPAIQIAAAGDCKFYDGSTLSDGSSACYKGDKYTCSKGSLTMTGKSDPSCKK